MVVRRALAVAVAAALAAATLTSCGPSHPSVTPALHWQAAVVPAPSGRRPIVQRAVWCGVRWYAAGATADSRGGTRPAVWSSRDARTWHPVVLHPGSNYYAQHAILTSVACSHGRIAALGAKPGGPHGNPRVETWRQLPDGSLAAVTAPFAQYGGADTVSVNRLSGGKGGYQVTGTRITGAAVWSSSAGAHFTLHEDAPGLASTPSSSTQALDTAWWRGSWTVVGYASRSDGRLVGTAWSGARAGPWTAVSLPGCTRVSTAERVVLTQSGPVVAGLCNRAFGIWSEHGDQWSQDSTFGAQQAGGTSPVFVSGLAWTGRLLAASYSDGAHFRLAVGPAGALSVVPLPQQVDDVGNQTATVSAQGDDLLLVTDDGQHPHLWLADAAVR